MASRHQAPHRTAVLTLAISSEPQRFSPFGDLYCPKLAKCVDYEMKLPNNENYGMNFEVQTLVAWSVVSEPVDSGML